MQVAITLLTSIHLTNKHSQFEINVRKYQKGNQRRTIQKNRRQRKTKQKHNNHYLQANTNNVNKTCAYKQLEVKMNKTSQRGTQNVKTHNRTTQITKKMSNTDLTKNPGVNSSEIMYWPSYWK